MNSSLNAEQQKAFDLILSGENIALCGAAGTGKSVLLLKIITALTVLKLKVAVTAPTGVAANILNTSEISATTLHYWAGCGLFDKSVDSVLKYVQARQDALKRWLTTDVLVIDEISMVSPELLEKLEQLARRIRSNPKPFGGIQLVCCGDWFQLPPVKKKGGFTDPKYANMDFCFETNAWSTLIKASNVVILKENFRQKGDPQFQRVLEEIREGVLTEESSNILKSRLYAKLDSDMKPTYLMPRKKNVDLENRNAIDSLNSKSVIFKWDYEEINMENLDKKKKEYMIKNFKKDLQVEELIELKVGAVIILLVNLDVGEGYVNGMQGIVISFDDGNPVVRFANGKTLTVLKYKWAKRIYQKGVSEFCGICVSQIPLKLAYALTIHKAQSISLDRVKLDLGSSTFEGGQAYTGISRCRSLDGLSLTDFDPDSIIVNPKAVAFYQQYFALKHLVIDDGGDSLITDDMILKLINKYNPPDKLGEKRINEKKRLSELRAEKLAKKARLSKDEEDDDDNEICPF
jgi:ATP-dependent DNA helicase PIF1